MYKKRYGQNFLINNNISKKILFEEKITNQDILEIGTGNLALTKLIVTEKPKKFIGIEVDTDMRDVYLQNNILENIIFEDALSVNERKLIKNGNFSIVSEYLA